MMEEEKVFDAFYDLPDGYQVQLMVIRDVVRGRGRPGEETVVYRSRIWVGTRDEPEPLLYRGQEHQDPRVAVDACFSLLLSSAPKVIDSPPALEWIHQLAHSHFAGGVRT